MRVTWYYYLITPVTALSDFTGPSTVTPSVLTVYDTVSSASETYSVPVRTLVTDIAVVYSSD